MHRARQLDGDKWRNRAVHGHGLHALSFAIGTSPCASTPAVRQSPPATGFPAGVPCRTAAFRLDVTREAPHVAARTPISLCHSRPTRNCPGVFGNWMWQHHLFTDPDPATTTECRHSRYSTRVGYVYVG